MRIKALHQAFLQGDLSPVEVVQESIAHVDAWQARTRLFTHVTAEAALSEARSSEERYRRGTPRSRLDGVLVGLKDLIDVHGEPTTAGSRGRVDHRAEHDAPVVARLKEAGANLALGKLNLHEFAYGPTGTSSHFGATRNPYDAERMAGGSSSGSGVAVAAGLVSAALGTDTGGSIRIPASFCGISGIKPTYGLVPTEGVVPLSWSLDHVGPMARTVEDVAEVLGVLLGTTLHGTVPDQPRVFWPDEAQLAGFDPRVLAAVGDAVAAMQQAMGARVVRGPLEEIQNIWLAQSIIIGAEALSLHWPRVSTHPEQYQPDVADRLFGGGAVSAVEYLQALRFRQKVAAYYDQWMRTVDVVVLPTVPILPPRLDALTVTNEAGGREDVRGVVTRFTNPFNFLGLPALSIPWGMVAGLPVGLQMVGARGEDANLLALGERLQSLCPERLPDRPEGALA